MEINKELQIFKYFVFAGNDCRFAIFFPWLPGMCSRFLVQRKCLLLVCYAQTIHHNVCLLALQESSNFNLQTKI